MSERERENQNRKSDHDGDNSDDDDDKNLYSYFCLINFFQYLNILSPFHSIK